VLNHYAPQIEQSQALASLGVEAGKYMLVTLHRAENVDLPERMTQFIDAFQRVSAEYGVPVICSLHPRTRSQLQKQGKTLDSGNVRAFDPVGFADFVALEKNARCVLTDSGTVQEETCIFGIPNVTIRDVTERPETIEVGSNILSGANPDNILRCVNTVMNMPARWTPPHEYLVPDVSTTVTKIVLGYLHRR
jgi:UDP-N-acetylglucosamine 2-epimerase (non-hydrolysing)